MDRPFEIAAGWAKANGIDPKNIFLGEFGMIRQEYGNPLSCRPPRARPMSRT